MEAVELFMRSTWHLFNLIDNLSVYLTATVQMNISKLLTENIFLEYGESVKDVRCGHFEFISEIFNFRT